MRSWFPPLRLRSGQALRKLREGPDATVRELQANSKADPPARSAGCLAPSYVGPTVPLAENRGEWGSLFRGDPIEIKDQGGMGQLAHFIQ